MAFDPKRTAVVLIEFQNDFASEGGALHGAVQDVMERTGMLDNARTLPLLFASPPSGITCDGLKNLTQPTLVLQGEKTQTYYALISAAISKCVPNAQRVILPNANHAEPARDPAGFGAAVVEYLSKR